MDLDPQIEFWLITVWAEDGPNLAHSKFHLPFFLVEVMTHAKA